MLTPKSVVANAFLGECCTHAKGQFISTAKAKSFLSSLNRVLLIVMFFLASVSVVDANSEATITVGERFTYTFTQQPEDLGIYEIAGSTLCEDAEITIKRTRNVISATSTCAISDLRIDFLIQNGSWIYRGKAYLSKQKAIASTKDSRYNLIRTYPVYLGEFNIREAAVQETPALDAWERARQHLLLFRQHIFTYLKNWRNI